MRLEDSSASGAALATEAGAAGMPVLHDGESLSPSQGEALWLPVGLASVKDCASRQVQAAFPSDRAEVEAIPGILDTGKTKGMLCVVSQAVQDVSLDLGAVVDEMHNAAVRTPSMWAP